jgi:uncharacterized protein
MKYALVLGLVMVVFWLWRSTRQSAADEQKQARTPAKPASLGKATQIVACQVCQVHLPHSEALIGSQGFYCSAEHRQQAGD